MTNQCPKCGAPKVEGEDCATIFWTQQETELHKPGYYAVHQLSVPAYMLQHNEYSKTGWIRVRNLMSEFLFEGLTPQYARQKLRDEVDSGNRKTSLTRGEKLTEVDDITWTFTVADVRTDTAEHYCDDVRKWAESVYRDSQAMVDSLPPQA
jgi:hypothetical protein